MGRMRQVLDWLTVAQAQPRPTTKIISGTSTPRGYGPRMARMTFDTYAPVDQVIQAMHDGAGRASQAQALAVPGVLRARNIVCGPSTWPMVDLTSDNRRHRNPLLDQMDPNVTNVVTFAQFFQDLLFEGVAWGRVLTRDAQNWPTHIEHLDVSRVTIQPMDGTDGSSPLPSTQVPREAGQLAQIYVDGVPANHMDIKRFDSPNPGVLVAAGDTIKLAATYRLASEAYAKNPRMDGYLFPKEGADPFDDDEDASSMLDDWERARREHTTGYVPAALGYQNVDALSPADLQLIQLHEQATKDVALALGLEPEDLGISTTSRTYANVVDRRIDRINDLLQAYVLAFTQRLSMPDITRAGHVVYADPNAYLRANPAERIAYYKGMVELNAMDSDDVADGERVPRKAKRPEVTAQPVTAGGTNVVPLRPPAPPSRLAADADVMTFAAEPARFESAPVAFAHADDRRTITGRALPYGLHEIGRKGGRKYRFVQGSIVWPDPHHVPLLVDHVQAASIGAFASITDGPNGTDVVGRVAPGPLGDQALAWASPDQSVRTGFSVGVDFDESACVPDPDNPGVWIVPPGRAIGKEISLVAVPSFQNARVTAVTLSADTGGTTMFCQSCGHVHAPGVAQCDPTALAAAQARFSAPPTDPNPAPQPPVPAPQPPVPAGALPPAGATFTADQMGAIFAQFAGRQPAVDMTGPGPQFVNPVPAAGTPGAAAAPPAQVTEAAPYRFDHEGNLAPGPQYDFSADLVRAMRDKDGEAYRRALTFMREMTVGTAYGMRRHAFDVDRADLTGLNPTRQRPDMYVPQRGYQYPLTQATRRGTLADITAFTLPKFNSASGLVAAHTEGVEPTPGTFTVTTQTITPTAKSGAIDMTREAWDQGGTPAASALIWAQFERAWYEALEQGVATFLNTLTAATDITLAAGTADAVLARAWRAAIARLQFVRGGAGQFDTMATEAELYVALATAQTTGGEPIFPMLNPANRDGTSQRRYSSIDTAGVLAIPAWALASTAGAPNNSWLFDSETVHTWDTGPQRLEFPGINAAGDYSPVAYVRLAVWGYQAIANTDINGVRQVIYDTVA